MSQPLVSGIANAKDVHHDEADDLPFSVPKDALKEMARQVIEPDRRRRMYGFTLDGRFSSDDIVTYRRGSDYVMAINPRRKEGSVSINMGTGGFRTQLVDVMQQVRAQDEQAAIMTTGASVGSSMINADHERMTDMSVQQTARWAKNR